MPEELQTLARSNAPILALSDLGSLWKKNESAVRGFLTDTPAKDISRVTVAALRSEIEKGQGAHSTDTREQRDQPTSRPATPSRSSNKIIPDPEPDATLSHTGPVAILCRQGGDIGRILTDHKASFDDGARLEEVHLSDIELLEVIDA